MQNDEICVFCGQNGPFPAMFDGASLRESRCPACNAPRRCRDLMRVVLAESGGSDKLSSLSVYELQARGHVHDALKHLPRYTCSEYLPGVPLGSPIPAEPISSNPKAVGANKHGSVAGKTTACDHANTTSATNTGCGTHHPKNNGTEQSRHATRALAAYCQDATALTFADNSFDIVISQDVMEHIEDTWQAFKEINRVLKPGGKHIFTIPLHEGRHTRSRAALPKLYHGDPLNPKGALVHWDFGDDLPEILQKMDIKTRLALSAKFYKPAEICKVDNKEDYERYLDFMARRDKIRFFLYNSNVFVAEKIIF